MTSRPSPVKSRSPEDSISSTASRKAPIARGAQGLVTAHGKPTCQLILDSVCERVLREQVPEVKEVVAV